jgi:hypothetical protein
MPSNTSAVWLSSTVPCFAPSHPVNGYANGIKILPDDACWSDLTGFACGESAVPDQQCCAAVPWESPKMSVARSENSTMHDGMTLCDGMLERKTCFCFQQTYDSKLSSTKTNCLNALPHSEDAWHAAGRHCPCGASTRLGPLYKERKLSDSEAITKYRKPSSTGDGIAEIISVGFWAFGGLNPALA